MIRQSLHEYVTRYWIVYRYGSELLEDTGSDQQSSTGLSETSTFYHTTSLQEAQDSSQPVLTCWEME
jgi:hypothetical protein